MSKHFNGGGYIYININLTSSDSISTSSQSFEHIISNLIVYQLQFVDWNETPLGRL